MRKVGQKGGISEGDAVIYMGVKIGRIAGAGQQKSRHMEYPGTVVRAAKPTSPTNVRSRVLNRKARC